LFHLQVVGPADFQMPCAYTSLSLDAHDIQTTHQLLCDHTNSKMSRNFASEKDPNTEMSRRTRSVVCTTDSTDRRGNTWSAASKASVHNSPGFKDGSYQVFDIEPFLEVHQCYKIVESRYATESRLITYLGPFKMPLASLKISFTGISG
jgi:hypothetical protein